MRFVVAATFLLAAGGTIAACSSFDGDAPTTGSDAGADEDGFAARDASSQREASVDATPANEAGAGCTLCDDFERAPSLLLQGWDRIHSSQDHIGIELSPDSVHGSALRVRASNGTGPEASLEKSLPLGTATKLDVAFDFLESKAFQANLLSLTLLDAQDKGQVFLITVNATDLAGALQTVTDSSDYGSVRTTKLPKVGIWHHARLSVDFASTNVDVELDNLPMAAGVIAAKLNKYSFERVVLNLGVTYTAGGSYDAWFDNLDAQLR